mmetsp:Transcript_3637/g.4247  ORF Transcript_3637/g.4247 Transcript_3637/m.4247 type:complete len:179 (+) Transcript_3637:408-944(+)
MHCNPFKESEPNSLTLEEIKEMNETNVFGPSNLSKVFVERFDKRERSAIVIVSSIAGYTPLPINQHYSGTKAFLKSFSNGIGFEVSDKIDVLALCPGYVTTQLNGWHTGPDAATPNDCAKVIFRDIGYEREQQPLVIQEFSLLIGHTIEFFSQGLAFIGLKPMMIKEHELILKSKKKN